MALGLCSFLRFNLFLSYVRSQRIVVSVRGLPGLERRSNLIESVGCFMKYFWNMYIMRGGLEEKSVVRCFYIYT